MKKREKFSRIITVSITGYRDEQWRSKLKEIEKFKISRASLFLERFTKRQRDKIYQALLKSKIKEIPLVHIRNDMARDELVFLAKKYRRPYFTIHESSFKYLDKWRGFHKNLYLEMNYDNYVSAKVKVGKVGGFCVDLAHFKAGEEKFSKDFEYVVEMRKKEQYFKCNHISGYSFARNSDIHFPKNLKDFDYLKTLPEFLFGDVMAIEVDNGIAEQLKFKDYLVKMLSC